MLRNRQIAEEKRKAKIRETERLQNESLSTPQNTMTTQETNDTQRPDDGKDKQTEVETQRSEEKENVQLDEEITKENFGEKSSETAECNTETAEAGRP